MEDDIKIDIKSAKHMKLQKTSVFFTNKSVGSGGVGGGERGEGVLTRNCKFKLV